MKRILVITDVYNWIGHTRAKYMQKHLSNEFMIHIMDSKEFNVWERETNKDYFSDLDFHDYIPVSPDKTLFNFDDFKKFSKQKRKLRTYDLYYFLFHTMLVKQSVKRILNTDARVATVVTGFPTLKNIFYDRNRNIEKAKNKFLPLANKCVAIGANNYKSLNDLRTIYDARKTFYAPRGVDPDVFFPMTEKFKRKDNENMFTIAYVGKPVPEKGLKEFIMPACEKASVEIIFNDRNYEDALPPEEMNKFYNKADAYVVASTIDGTPNPALEAASCGKPIISNEIGNMPEFIVDGENGFLLKKMSVGKYAQKLMWMKKNQKRSFEMGQNARAEILKNWTYKKSIERKREIFRRLLNVS